jgi:hypothetical protein
LFARQKSPPCWQMTVRNLVRRLPESDFIG